MQVSFNANNVIFTDDKNKATSFEIFDAMQPLEAVRAVSKELHVQGSASRGAVSLLTAILDNPRFDGYKGTTPWNEGIPAEFKGAVRQAEDEYIKPIFFEAHGNPNPHAGVHEKDLSPEQKAERKKFSHVSGLLDSYLKNMRAGGSYAVARGFVLEWFAKGGQRPITDNGKLYSVAALKKLIAIEKKAAAPTEDADTGLAGKLRAMCQKIETHEGNDWAFMGEPNTAIASLHYLLEKYEALREEQAEQATETASITGLTQSTIAHAARENEEALV